MSGSVLLHFLHHSPNQWLYIAYLIKPPMNKGYIASWKLLLTPNLMAISSALLQFLIQDNNMASNSRNSYSSEIKKKKEGWKFWSKMEKESHISVWMVMSMEENMRSVKIGYFVWDFIMPKQILNKLSLWHVTSGCWKLLWSDSLYLQDGYEGSLLLDFSSLTSCICRKVRWTLSYSPSLPSS